MSNERAATTLMKHPSQPQRAAQTDIPAEQASIHIIIALVYNRDGALDRILNVLRRRRINMQSFAVSHSEVSGINRVTVVMNDAEVSAEHLLEQLRKIVDVQEAYTLSPEHAIMRQLTLVKVNRAPQNYQNILELSHLRGAYLVDVSQETLTLEISGDEEKVEEFLGLLEQFGIRDIARTGCVAMARK